MANVPEILYSLPLLKDIRTQPIDLVFRRRLENTGGNSSIQITNLYRVPNDRIAILQSWGGQIFPDPAGGSPNDVGLFLRQAQGGDIFLDSSQPGFAWGIGKTWGALGGSVNIWAPPGSEIGIFATFSVPGTHQVEGSISLISIPRGSVSLG